ncbi:MAG: hypothetical protein LBH25_08655 [Fibromonadaceae bacterium]|nr:hypothetical protein [Fibromonadaceae bacterium]
MFEVVQKKGNENNLCGRVIGYVRVLRPEAGEGESPFDAFISQDGILAIQGDYSKNSDFEAFRNNLQQSLPKGLQEILKHILDDDELRENLDLSKTKNISVSVFPKGSGGIGDFFPVPAQLATFQSEDALLNEDADIYFLGEFGSISNAHLFLMGFPILYQSKYREQAERTREQEVDTLLAEIDGNVPEAKPEQSLALRLDGDLSIYKGNLLELLGTVVLPKIMYSIEESDSESFKSSISTFYRFMRTYPHQQDIEKMVSILQKMNEEKHSSSSDSKNLALLCQKMSALHHEEFERLPAIQKELEGIC